MTASRTSGLHAIARQVRRARWPLSPLIGREREEAAITHLLAREDIRLLNLTGPAGIGKTRLTQQIATTTQANFANGFVFVELESVSDPAFVQTAIAQALGMRGEAGQSLGDQLRAHLAEQELLLILDNFEQVMEAAPLVMDLLVACPQVKALVTSRAALHIRGEQEFALPPLDIPDLAHLPELTDLAEYAAVALFVRRAQAIRPTFRLTPALAPLIAAITVRLDGLPLAIELAATRIKTLTPQALLARLEASLLLLSHGPIDLPERQQTMRSAIAWSYDLLNEPEQRLFRRLGVFSGGWTLEAMEAVCTDSPTETPQLLDQLTALIDKSLVIAEETANGEPRFRMLHLIWEYAKEQLVVANEEPNLRQRHANYYLAFAEAAKPHLHGADQIQWLTSLDQEHANLRAALRWAAANGDGTPGLRLATQLWWFWQVRGYAEEGRNWLESLLAHQRPPESTEEMALRAAALSAAGNLAWNLGDYAPGREYLEESLHLYRCVGDIFGQAFSLNTLGLIADERGQRDAAVSLFEAALELFQTLPERNSVAMVYDNLASVAFRSGQYNQAISLYEKSLVLQEAAGNQESVAGTIGNLAYTLYLSGDISRAAELMEQSLALFEKLGDKEGMAFVLGNLSDLVLEQGDLAQAITLLREGFTLALEVGKKRRIWNILDSAATLAYKCNLPTQAARLLALATALGERLQAARSEDGQSRYESLVTLLKTTLGEVAFNLTWGSGRTMSLNEAEKLLAALTPPDVESAQLMMDRWREQHQQEATPKAGTLAKGRGPRRSTSSNPGGLTNQQLVVLRLLADGLHNSEIAVTLQVTPKTVEHHVSAVLAKLNVQSRGQAISQAYKLRLFAPTGEQPQAP